MVDIGISRVGTAMAMCPAFYFGFGNPSSYFRDPFGMSWIDLLQINACIQVSGRDSS